MTVTPISALEPEQQGIAAHSSDMNVHPAQPSRKSQRDETVEALRFCACFIVITHHFLTQFCPRGEFGSAANWVTTNSWSIGEGFYKNVVFDFFSAGQSAVILFFLLSGYVLSKPILEKRERDFDSLSADAIKRIVRLGLPLIAAVLLSYVCANVGWYQKYALKTAEITGSLWTKQMFVASRDSNAALLAALLAPFQESMRLLNPTWTIGIELIGSYLCFGLSAVIVNSRLANWLLMAAFLISPDYLKLFVLGTAYAQFETLYGEGIRVTMSKLKKNWLMVSTGSAMALIGLLLFVYPGHLIERGELLDTYWSLLLAPDAFLAEDCGLKGGVSLIGVCILFVTAKLFLLEENSVISFLAKFGKQTYTLYLYHTIVLGTLASWCFLRFHKSFAANPLLCCGWTLLCYYIFNAVVCKFTNKIDEKSLQLSCELKKLYLKSLRN